MNLTHKIITLLLIAFSFLSMLPMCLHADTDNLNAAINISAAGMHAQNERLKIISENLANKDVTGMDPNADPYRRKQIFFTNVYDPKVKATTVKVAEVAPDHSAFILKYQPHHPAANTEGYVKYPNVNSIIEGVDAKEAQRSFEANLSAMEIAKTNQSKIIDLMR